MRLLSAALADFRNIAAAEITFDGSFTGLFGANGQGKTNTLEALYLAAALRPLRPVQRRVLYREGTRAASVQVRLQSEVSGLEHDLKVALAGPSRTLIKDDKKTDARGFIGRFVAVAFTPDDLQLAKGGPDARRRFLDRALLNQRPAYLERAARYARALKDRNRVLQQEGDDALLAPFDALVATEGAEITRLRRDYVRALRPRLVRFFQDIADPAPPLEISYASKLPEDLPDEALPEALAAELARRRPQDRRLRRTTAGPHLDDLRLSLGGGAAKERASQGQHRALVLALKLAEITHLAEVLGEPPVLLLDDMSSELDPGRSAQLFSAIRALDAQVVLTSTDTPQAFRARLGGAPLRAYHVVEGQLHPDPPTRELRQPHGRVSV